MSAQDTTPYMGAVVHWAAQYDLLLWILTLGNERRFRARLLAPAKLQPSEAVLDVGCGTGTLAIVAKQQVGSSGQVAGIDASTDMIERATQKAAKAGVHIDFRIAFAQSLPFPDHSFHVVVNTVMMHHLPRAGRTEAMRDMQRVLKPGGRLLSVDFGRPSTQRRGLLAHIHRHGGGTAQALVDLANDAGMRVLESGPIGAWDLQYALAEKGRAG